MTPLLRALRSAPDDEAVWDILDLWGRREPQRWERTMLRVVQDEPDDASEVEAERWVA